MNNKEVVNLKFTQENISLNLELSDNFNTEHPIFEELAFYLGALEYNHQKDSPSIHLTTLEKLEILCKKAREYADEESSYSDSYNEVRVLVNNDKYSLDTPINLATSYDDIKLIDNNLLLVKNDSLFGVVDVLGKEILPIQYEEIYLLNHSVVLARTKDLISLYSKDGVELLKDLEEVSENYNPFGANDDYYWLKKEGKWGLFNYKLNQIIPFRLEYDSCELVSDKVQENIYIQVTKNGKCGLINGLLNVEVISLDSEIESIVLSTNKSYLVIKKDNSQTPISEEELNKIEEKIKYQN
ncbi:hypothetical protein SDC9_02302 [bioreactor metagenome]|uniref:WG repeat-containing protein n=1 Tax=bioreactor metagenome TaxID=1076179 RepID=A0A644ST11_9ZZZZ